MNDIISQIEKFSHKISYVGDIISYIGRCLRSIPKYKELDETKP